jgi:hexosaminidase
VNERLTSLVPFPRVVRPRSGWLAFDADPAVAVGPGAESAAAAFRRVLAALPWPGDARVAGGTGRARDGRPAPGEITVDVGRDLPDEGYRLAIGTDRVRVTAGGAAGAYYAAQTLRQLLPDEAWRAAPVPGPAWRLPCAEIEDAPALRWRGAHIDVARHFFPKRELLSLIDALAAVKLNRFHLHLTDDQGWRIESRRYPVLHEVGSHRARTRISHSRAEPAYEDVPHGGYYTLADLAEIACYAAQRMMTLVPEIEVPGHACALLAAMPRLGAGAVPAGGRAVQADWGIFPQLMSPLPETREFLGEIFAELLGAVPARYVHMGGDECVLASWDEDPAVQEYRRGLGLATGAQLHARFLREIADLLADDHGVRALVWDEGFESAAAAGDGLRPDTIVMAWRGMDIARRAAEAGHEVVAAPVRPTYFDYSQADHGAEPLAIGGPITIEDVAALRPVGDDWPDQAAARLLGVQFQVWTEYIRDGRALEYMIFPRACALAEVAWTGGPSAWNGAGTEPAERPGPTQAARKPERAEPARARNSERAEPTQARQAGPAEPGVPTGRPPLRDRVAAHLRRLDAAGVAYRPLDGPHPWQRAGGRRNTSGLGTNPAR